MRAKKLAAIDFEVKDIHNTSMTASQSSTADLTDLVKLAHLLDRKHVDHIEENEFSPYYENEWIVYESGTALALDETISVKVTAYIKPGYKLGMDYCINFHQKLKRSFTLGHLLLDGSECAGGILPDSYVTELCQENENRIMYRNMSCLAFNTPKCEIRFQNIDPLVQLILGMRKIGFRLFLFDTPPNPDVICNTAFIGYDLAPGSPIFQ